MTHQEIKELAGHREVPPWVIKLVGDAVAKAVERERYACINICLNFADVDSGPNGIEQDYHAKLITARGQQ